MHQTRLWVALIFLPAFFLIVKYLPTFFFLLLIMVVVVLGQYEFFRLFYAEELPPVAYFGLFLGPLSTIGFYFNHFILGLFSLVGILGLLLIFQVFFFKDIKKVFAETGVVFLGVVYIGWLLGHLVLLRGFQNGEWVVFYLFLVTWAGDSGAYYTGKIWGKRKLYEAVSPGKTIAGSVGGLVSSVGVSFVGKFLFLPSLSYVDCLGLGLLLGALGQLGDLTESLFKRSSGKKDSGQLIPGHGGVLDKVDSLLFTGPAFYYFLLFIKGLGKGSMVL
ncbi:MAG TPA: phosphatidate cytidylyltransferase [Nitrospiria bacterium]